MVDVTKVNNGSSTIFGRACMSLSICPVAPPAHHRFRRSSFFLCNQPQGQGFFIVGGGTRTVPIQSNTTMKRKNRSKRSLGSLPKGLPVRGAKDVNPFESASRHKRQKHEVVNRNLPGTQNSKLATQTALARALAERKEKLRTQLQQSKKSSTFVDKRIGEYSRQMTREEQNLARIVKERSRRSKRSAKFSLQDEEDDRNEGGNNDILTHKGKAIDGLADHEHVMLSDDEDDLDRQLDAVDTLQHFGGGKFGNKNNNADNPYGPAGAATGNLSAVYSSRKMELDDLIHRRKVMKAERMQSKEAQVDAFEKMDESFADLAAMLNFRDKEKEIRDYHTAKRQGKLSAEDQDYDDWDREMKQYQFVDRKVKATDRIKTDEEIAKEEAERLHELETRRLARMNGEFDEDDFSDISGVELEGRRHGAEDLDDDSSDEGEREEELRTRFTADGLVKIDKHGKVVEKVGEISNDVPQVVLPVGTRVSASYHAKEQMEGEETWFNGSISSVNRDKKGKITYNIDYEDGDFEDNVAPEHVRVIEKTEEEVSKEKDEKSNALLESQKRQKAQEKARYVFPSSFVVRINFPSRLHFRCI